MLIVCVVSMLLFMLISVDLISFACLSSVILIQYTTIVIAAAITFRSVSGSKT